MLGIDFLQVLLHAFNVIILFGGLYILLYSPVKKFMAKREAYYASLDSDAKRIMSDAENMRSEYEAKLAGVDDEIAAKRKKASAELEEARRLRNEEAAEEAAKIIAEAKEDADKKREAIIADARLEISAMINDAADKLMLASSEDEIYNAFLADAERSAGNAGE